MQTLELGPGSAMQVFTPWQEEDVAPVVFGPQGGAMLAARYRVRGAVTGCIAQRTTIVGSDGQLLDEDDVPLKVYPQDDSSFVTETHWLTVGYIDPLPGTQITVEAEVGAASAKVALSIGERQ